MDIIGLDVGGTNIKAGLVRNGKIIQRGHYPTRTRKSDRSVVDQIRSAIRDYGDRAATIGIGIAGIIDSPRGIVRYSPNLGWEDMPLGKILTKEFHRPVRIINDVNAILYGEWHYGAARGYDDVFLFTLGTGVGGAAICGGKMVFGANGFAGEFGHATINFNGPKCTCGNYGCLESYVGTKFFLRRARRRMRKIPTRLRRYPRLTPKIIGDEAKKGDRLSRELFGEIGYYLGIGISNLLNLFDPALIVISGGIARAGRFLFPPIRQVVKDTDQGARHRRYKIVTGKLGDDAGILGAAYHASLKQ
jgi:glucokinase